MAGTRGKTTRQAKPAAPGKLVRVAIVGGGCAGLATAWQLSRLGGYEVHVYEKSWRLGGKGASGRDADGRIREHGLHIWLGFYENAFRMMRECYDEVGAHQWGPNAKKGDRLAHGSMDEAFFPEPHIGVAVRDGADDGSLDALRQWQVWSGYLPPAEGLPGEPLDAATNPFTLPRYLLRCYELLKTLMLSVVAPGDGPVPGRTGTRSAVDASLDLNYAYDEDRTPEEIVAWSARVLRGTALTAAAILLQSVYILENLLERLATAPQGEARGFQLMTAVLAQVRKLLCDVVAIDPVVRRKTEIIDIVMTIAIGLYRDRVLFGQQGLDAINGFDYRQWLRSHGANPAAVDSEFISGIYDLTFAYRDAGRGKMQRQLAAGVALRGALRMFFTYRGSMFWRMRSGMGDAIFAPLYKVLLERGVQFHFQHALRAIHLETIGNERFVRRLDFHTDGNWATLDQLAGDALDHFGCWPDDAQRFDAARASAKGKESERTVTEFDAVVFAMGVDDFLEVADREGFLAALPAHWRAIRDRVRTVATQSAQVWLASDLEQLGWYRGSGIITALPPPFETWADMTHTLATERAWRQAKGIAESPHDKARSVAYFCGVLPDGAAPTQAAANLDGLLQRGLRPLWPQAFANGASAARLQVGAAHVQANVQGSDRYTLSLPGTIQYRISPLDRSVANMTIAGDWTASGLDAGCVEGAVMSGMLAAFAISDEAAILDAIVGYDHP